MDKELVKIYNNISVKKTGNNNYRINIFIPYIKRYKEFYYKSKEDYLNDCSELFNKLEEKLEEGKVSRETLETELKYYILFKSLKEKRIIIKNININQDILKEVIEKYENNFKNYIEEKYPLKEFKIYSRIYNLRLSIRKEKFGIYTLYKTSKNKKDLKEYLKFLKKNMQTKTSIVLETRVRARDQIQANKIAQDKREFFLDIINFIAFSHVNIEDLYLLDNEYTLTLTDDFITENVKIELPNIINFDDIKKSLYFSKLLSLMEERELSFIESKIKISLHWYREFLHEKNGINSLLKGMIALESLISTKKLKKSEGVKNYIIRAVPVILEKNKKILTNQIKELYLKRSAIVHEGIADVTENNKNDLKRVLYGIFEKFLLEKYYQELTTPQKYNSFFKELKYKEKYFCLLNIIIYLKKVILNREKIKITIIEKSELCKKDRTTYYKDSSGEIFEFPLFKGSTSSRKIEKIYVLDGEFIKAISKDFTNSVSFCQDCYLKVKGKCKREYKSICRNLNINYELVDWYNILFLSEFPFYKNLVSEQFKKRFKIELENIKNGESFILEEN